MIFLIFGKSTNQLYLRVAALSFLSFNLLSASCLVLTAKAGTTTANITASPFAMRCRDTQTATPYAKSFLEWTSTFAGSPPYPGQYYEVAFNAGSKSGYASKFQVQATYLGTSGTFKGYVTYDTQGGVPYIPPKSDVVICR